jgi:hypothetical protein
MSARRRRVRRKGKIKRNLPNAVTGAVTLGIAALAAQSADAATFTVTNLNDSGAGSLRDAVTQANSTAGPDVINFQPGLTGTITLTSGELSLYDSVDIQGPGAAVITVSGNDTSRIFYIYSSAATPIDVTISGLTLTHGFDGGSGGAINDVGENLTLDHDIVSKSVAGEGSGGGVAKFQNSGTLHIHNTTVTGNTAGLGGGVFFYSSDAAADIQDSVISNNHAYASGGGIYLYNIDSDVTIARTTISGNTADCCGGGMFLYGTSGGKLTIDASTISGNIAGNVGGAAFLYYINDPLTIQNSTISGNQASYVGGIFFYSAYASPTISLTTIAGNSASGAVGGVFLYGGTLPVDNSIIAGNSAPVGPDVAGSGTFDLNYSLVQDTTAANVTVNPGSITGVPAQLGPLQNNGGPTQTMMPAPTSPVINAGDPAFAPPSATDQRGFARVVAGRVDMGAVEVNGGVFQLSSATYSVNEDGASITITVNRTGGTDPATVNYATSNGSASAGADYTASSGTLNFAAGQTSATFNVPILDDTLVEGNETFNLTLSSPSAGATLGAQATAVVTIVDVEPGQFQFSSATYSVAENGGSITITVNRVNGSTNAASVNYTTSNGSATAGADYTTSSGTLNFAIGQTSATFNVPILDDNLVEGNEAFNLALGSPTNGAALGSPSTAVVTITDFEPGTVQFSSATASVNEGSSVTLTVTRTNGSSGPLTVNFTATSGTATSGADFPPTSGSVTFADGDATPKTIVIPATADGTPEPPEDYTVTLSSPSAGSLGAPSAAVVTIIDPSTIPVFGALAKMLLALFTAITGVFMINRNRLSALFVAVVLASAIAAPPLHAQHAIPRTTAKHAKSAKADGILQSVSSSNGSVVVTLQGGQTITLQAAKLRVIDLRQKKRKKSTLDALTAGMHVKVVTGPPAKIKILG